MGKKKLLIMFFIAGGFSNNFRFKRFVSTIGAVEVFIAGGFSSMSKYKFEKFVSTAGTVEVFIAGGFPSKFELKFKICSIFNIVQKFKY